MREFRIYLDDWLQGEGPGPSSLYRLRDEKQCCLGQLAEECGVPLSLLCGYTTLATCVSAEDQYQALPPDLDWLLRVRLEGWGEDTRVVIENSPAAEELMQINDSPIDEAVTKEPEELAYTFKTRQEKEALLTQKFAAHGLVPLFVPGHRPR